jgi:hypothetical protein
MLYAEVSMVLSLFRTEDVLSVPTYAKKYNAQIQVTLFSEASFRRLF